MDVFAGPGGSDLEPVRGTCDICGHRHACYVGGQPSFDAKGEVVVWERQVCLGCLMRATAPDGFDECGDCDLQRTAAADRGGRHA